jgi:hypothetical protein
MLRSAVSEFHAASFCRWAGCVWMNSLLTVGISTSRISPRLTPIRTLESRCIVSSLLIVWACRECRRRG